MPEPHQLVVHMQTSIGQQVCDRLSIKSCSFRNNDICLCGGRAFLGNTLFSRQTDMQAVEEEVISGQLACRPTQFSFQQKVGEGRLASCREGRYNTGGSCEHPCAFCAWSVLQSTCRPSHSFIDHRLSLGKAVQLLFIQPLRIDRSLGSTRHLGRSSKTCRSWKSRCAAPGSLKKHCRQLCDLSACITTLLMLLSLSFSPNWSTPARNAVPPRGI